MQQIAISDTPPSLLIITSITAEPAQPQGMAVLYKGHVPAIIYPYPTDLTFFSVTFWTQ